VPTLFSEIFSSAVSFEMDIVQLFNNANMSGCTRSVLFLKKHLIWKMNVDLLM
jgi:hypothetical protein